MMVDRHVVKMILESAQLLSTAHRVLDGHEYIDTTGKRKVKRWMLSGDRDQHIYSATHVNHPSAKWVRESPYHYRWLYVHFLALMDEYTYRYGKTHACKRLCAYLMYPPVNIGCHAWHQPPCAMDPVYIISTDPVENYRNYYRLGKAKIHKWTKRSPPTWLVD